MRNLVAAGKAIGDHRCIRRRGGKRGQQHKALRFQG
jgi:hypothetical protein